MWEPIFYNQKFDLEALVLALASCVDEDELEGQPLPVDFPTRVFIAYLDRECNLLDVYASTVFAGADVVAVVAREARWRWNLTSPVGGMCQVLVGPAAELLYIAIAGRLLEAGPEDAMPGRAAIARAILAANLDRPGFSEAYAAVAHWGDFIMPWYGTLALDDCGRLLLDLEEYGDRIDIPMTVGVEA